jgi:hypothetical protein
MEAKLSVINQELVDVEKEAEDALAAVADERALIT